MNNRNSSRNSDAVAPFTSTMAILPYRRFLLVNSNSFIRSLQGAVSVLKYSSLSS